MPPQQWHRPPQKKSGMGVAGVLGTIFGSLAAVFVLLVIAVAAIGSSSSSDTSNPVAIPTYDPDDDYEPDPYSSDGPTRPSERPTERPTQRPTERPTERPTQRPTQRPTTRVTPPARVSVNTSLRNNSMYRAGSLPRLNCRGGNINQFNHSQLKALILKTGRCMDKAWQPILEKQGIQFRPPSYAIASRKGRGACGDYPSPGSMVPYYCPRNSTIYASTSALASGVGNSPGYGEIISWHGGTISMMAHEYGHHVQNITGLMNSWWSSTLDSGSQSGKLALSRRLELQATCFAGMWMRSVASSYPVNTSQRSRLFWFYGQVGDWPGRPRDHGKPVNNNRWFRQGWERSKTYQCNTWLAPSSTVS